MSAPKPQGFATASIHAGYDPDSLYGAINTPIYASTTFAQNGLNELRGGYEYTRCGNPTIAALEKTVAALEGATYGRAFSSGMAATDVLLRALLRPGDHLETPSNPAWAITDIAAVAKLLDGPQLVVDNTFASPYLQNPLALGADHVLHSTTKYLGGHSDVVGGVVVTNSAKLDEELAFLQGGAGAIPSVFDAYLTARGIKTLAVRMDRHCDNAEAIARHLQQSPKVKAVLYPGLETHPGHEVALKQMRRFGAMISVRFHDEAAARAFCLATRLICLAESLGGVESLVEHPATMTHQSVTGSTLEVPRDLVRISIGIEDLDDLIADIDAALAAVG